MFSPPFSNHRTESAPDAATSTSLSLSLSTSAKYTAYAPVSDVERLVAVNDCEPSF